MQPSDWGSRRSGSCWTLPPAPWQDPAARMSKGLGYFCQCLHGTKALKPRICATRKPSVSSAEPQMCFYELNILQLDCEGHQASSCLGYTHRCLSLSTAPTNVSSRSGWKGTPPWKGQGWLLESTHHRQALLSTVAALFFPLASRSEPTFYSTASSNSTP